MGQFGVAPMTFGATLSFCEGLRETPWTFLPIALPPTHRRARAKGRISNPNAHAFNF